MIPLPTRNPQRQSGGFGMPSYSGPNMGMILGGIAGMSGANPAPYYGMGKNFDDQRRQAAMRKAFMQKLQDPALQSAIPQSVKAMLPFMQPEAAARTIMQYQLSQAKKAPAGPRYMKSGNDIVQIGPDGKPQVIHQGRQSPLDEMKGRLLQGLIGGGNPQQGGVVPQSDTGGATIQPMSDTQEPPAAPNLIRPQTASPGGQQPGHWMDQLSPEQRRAMGLNMISPGMGNILLKDRKEQQYGEAATNDVQKKILNAEALYSRIQGMRETFEPKFQEITGRAAGTAYSFLAKLRGADSLTQEQTKYLTKYSKHRRRGAENLNLYIKEITGAQMSEAEAKRLSQAVPVPGTGLFDGDDPVTYKSKMDDTMRSVTLARARYHYLLRKGWQGTQMSAEDIARSMKEGRPPVSLKQIEGLIDQRGNQLQQQLRRQGLNQSQIDQQVIIQLKDEFGI